MVLLPRVAMLPGGALVVPRMVLLRAGVLRAAPAWAGRWAAPATPQPARKVLVAEPRPRRLLGSRDMLLDRCAAPADSRGLGAGQARGASAAGSLRKPEGRRAGHHNVITMLRRKSRAGGCREA